MSLTPEQAAFVSGYKVPSVPAAPIAPASDPRPGHHISAIARDQVGVTALKGQQQDILDIVIAAHRNGIDDLSGREIQARYRMVHVGKDIDTGTISARVNSLIAAKLLERGPERACAISKKMVGPVRPVARQTRLAA